MQLYEDKNTLSYIFILSPLSSLYRVVASVLYRSDPMTQYCISALLTNSFLIV